MRLRGRDKAVSTVIATVLMTTLTLTLGIMVFFWGSQTFGLQVGNAGIYFNNNSNSLLENIIIEDVWFNQTNKIYLTVRNIGSIDVSIKAVYVNSTSQTTSPAIPASGYQLTVGNTVTFVVTFSKTGFTAWTSNQFVYISVATARGLQVRGYWGTLN